MQLRCLLGNFINIGHTYTPTHLSVCLPIYIYIYSCVCLCLEPYLCVCLYLRITFACFYNSPTVSIPWFKEKLNIHMFMWMQTCSCVKHVILLLLCKIWVSEIRRPSLWIPDIIYVMENHVKYTGLLLQINQLFLFKYTNMHSTNLGQSLSGSRITHMVHEFMVMSISIYTGWNTSNITVVKALRY